MKTQSTSLEATSAQYQKLSDDLKAKVDKAKLDFDKEVKAQNFQIQLGRYLGFAGVGSTVGAIAGSYLPSGNRALEGAGIGALIGVGIKIVLQIATGY